jgi:vancomycin resistance protein YoaR
VIPLEVEKPDVTTADLEKRLFRDVLGEYTTTVTGSQGRKDNIDRASDEIDGTILLAGETFSFNKVVGERTRKRGYTKALSYPEGWTEEVMGGGITQVSSTLYMSAMLSNLKIDERDNQKYVTGYIEKGCDADVSWDGQDFCFTNNTKYPVRIDINCSDGDLEVVLKGSKRNKNTVEITMKILEVYEHETVYRSDKSLLRGKHVVMSSGIDGYKVQTYREIYDKKHKLISSKKEARSTYDSIKSVVAEGTRKPKKKPEKEPGQKTSGQGSSTQAPSEAPQKNQGADPNAGPN